MLGGAVAVLLTGRISIPDALRSINIDVMIFLFGMFIVGEALVASGYLAVLAHRFLSRAATPAHIILAILFGMGFFSALLMNDTLAIIGTPLVLTLALKYRISPKLLLLSLAMAITTGSVMSPIGNPQNLLVALNSGMASPFVTFGICLLIPTILSLCTVYLILRLLYPAEFSLRTLEPGPVPGCRDMEAMPVQCSLAILLILAGTNIMYSLVFGTTFIALPLIALAAAAPVILFSPQRGTVIRHIDWSTLVFFAAMFILMESVWQTGFFQSFINGPALTPVPAILAASVILSQFISNVPFVALFQPMIQQAGGSTVQLMALAAGSTIAGNLTLLGAASNVIIIQNAEKQGETLTFFEFARAGIPITLIQAGIYGIFLWFL